MTNLLLFSAELFSDTRLSQQPTGGVLLHIEDWLEGVQRSSRQKKPLKRSIKMDVKMQNKPNSKIAQMNTTPYLTRPYKNLPLHGRGKNKPNQSQYKAIFDPSAPYQSQFKPNQTQNKPNFKSDRFEVDYRSNFGYNTTTFWEFAFLNSGITKFGGTYKAE
jgi:hypothetical protein